MVGSAAEVGVGVGEDQVVNGDDDGGGGEDLGAAAGGAVGIVAGVVGVEEAMDFVTWVGAGAWVAAASAAVGPASAEQEGVW